MSRLIPRSPGHETVPAVISLLLDGDVFLLQEESNLNQWLRLLKENWRTQRKCHLKDSKGRCVCVCVRTRKHYMHVCISGPNSSPSFYRMPVHRSKGNQLKPRKRYKRILLQHRIICMKGAHSQKVHFVIWLTTVTAYDPITILLSHWICMSAWLGDISMVLWSNTVIPISLVYRPSYKAWVGSDHCLVY